jgi:hypothetical protein
MRVPNVSRLSLALILAQRRPTHSDIEKVALLQRCSCLLYTPANEHFGITPLEAMYCSRPVIAVNSGGPLETIAVSDPPPHPPSLLGAPLSDHARTDMTRKPYGATLTAHANRALHFSQGGAGTANCNDPQTGYLCEPVRFPAALCRIAVLFTCTHGRADHC